MELSILTIDSNRRQRALWEFSENYRIVSWNLEFFDAKVDIVVMVKVNKLFGTLAKNNRIE